MAIKHLFGYVPNQSSFFQLTDSQPYVRHKSFTSHMQFYGEKETNENRKNSKIKEVLSSCQAKQLKNENEDKTKRFSLPKSKPNDKSSFIPFSVDNFSFENQSGKLNESNSQRNSEIFFKKSKNFENLRDNRLSDELIDHKKQRKNVFLYFYF